MGDHHHHHHHQVDLLGDFLAATTTTTDTITDTTGALGAVASLSSGYIFLAQTPPPGILKMSNKAHKKNALNIFHVLELYVTGQTLQEQYNVFLGHRLD